MHLAGERADKYSISYRVETARYINPSTIAVNAVRFFVVSTSSFSYAAFSILVTDRSGVSAGLARSSP